MGTAMPAVFSCMLQLLLLLMVMLSCRPTEACGLNSTDLQGTIQSPNFPANYSDNLDCVYVITAPPGYQVTLNFTDFHLEHHHNCTFDYLEIRDGDENSPRIGRYCSSKLPPRRRTFGNQMWVRFFTDGSVTTGGFNATYTATPQAPYFFITSNIASSVGGSIHRMDVETFTNYVVPMNGSLYRPIAVDYDPVEETIYWTEVGQRKGIQGSALNGSGMHTVLNAGTTSAVDGLAVDPLSRLIFYTDAGRDLIAMLTMSTFAHKTIISTDLDEPRAIVLNTADGVMFWTDWGTAAKIERANYDGSDRRTLVNTTLYHPNALALDIPNNRLYWADAGTDRVEWCDMEGGYRYRILTLNSYHHFFGLTRLHNYLYITDWYSIRTSAQSMVVRVDIDTAIATAHAYATGMRLNDIHVVDPLQYLNNSGNGCGNDNGGCDVFCIPLSSNSSKCACPDGQTLTMNQTSCVVDECGWSTTNLTGTIRSPNFPGNYASNHNCTFIITAPAGFQITINFTDFDLEYHRRCLYDFVEIRDGDENSPLIGRFCSSTLPPRSRTFGNQMWLRFFSDGSVTMRGFQATFTAANLQAPYFFITSTGRFNVGGSIHRLDVETFTNYVVPMNGSLYRPIAVDYDPVEQTIYWTEVGLHKGIRGSALNGSGMHTVLQTDNNSTIEGLAVDPLSRLIFYTDAGRDLIAMLTMSTFAHKTIISTDLDEPRAIVLNTGDGVMFWTDRGAAPKIERANYDGSDRRTLVNTGLFYPNALALDIPNNRLYWVDAGMDRLEWCNMEGGNRSRLLLLNSLHHFFGLAHLHNFLYITDWSSIRPGARSMLIRFDLNTSQAILRGTSTARLNDIHAVDPQRNSDNNVNGCGNNNGGCEVICIPLPNNSSKCSCHDGQVLASDQTHCTDVFSVAVSSVDGQPFDAIGNRTMTLSCDPSFYANVTSYVWNVPCTGQAGSTCVFKPRPMVDDGKRVTCTATSSDGRVFTGGLHIDLNYPPQEAPTISGYSNDTVYQQGQRLNLSCSVPGGKPLVTAVSFSCGSTHQDTAPDIFKNTEVLSLLAIESLSVTDDGKTCVCTATWKHSDWYTMNATAVLRVQAVPQPVQGGQNSAAIAGGVVAAVIIIVIIIIIVFVIIRRRGPFYFKWFSGSREDDMSGILPSPRQQPPEAPEGEDQANPYVINGAYDSGPEVVDNTRNAGLETRDVAGAQAPDDLKPMKMTELTPTTYSAEKHPQDARGPSHAFSNPTDYC
ncbi:uncharacterized protein LOC143289997 isoform X2 [Babylonia areolata]|uniref:uncharacterized protein LOC143289997 isoform X2 n=1 Tax=Babylonia areolata TaxID=304850 RepID=UPI003FD0D5E8